MLKKKVLHLCIFAVPLLWEDWEDFIPTWTSPTCMSSLRWVHPRESNLFLSLLLQLDRQSRIPIITRPVEAF